MAIILDGKNLAETIKRELVNECANLKETYS